MIPLKPRGKTSFLHNSLIIIRRTGVQETRGALLWQQPIIKISFIFVPKLSTRGIAPRSRVTSDVITLPTCLVLPVSPVSSYLVVSVMFSVLTYNMYAIDNRAPRSYILTPWHWKTTAWCCGFVETHKCFSHETPNIMMKPFLFCGARRLKRKSSESYRYTLQVYATGALLIRQREEIVFPRWHRLNEYPRLWLDMATDEVYRLTL